MWIVPAPNPESSEASAFARGTAGSTSLSTSQSNELAQSVMWRGKPRAPGFWRARWKTVAWLPLLSGVTSEPSTLARGVESFISSLRGTHASRSATPETAPGRPTIATSGLTFIECWSKAARHGGSLRTSSVTSRSVSTRFSTTSACRASSPFGTSSARRKLERHIADSVFSSSPSTPIGFPSVVATDGTKQGMQRRETDVTLTQAAKDWTTATVPSRGPESRESKNCRGAGGIDLQTTAIQWSTTNGRDAKGGYETLIRSDGKSRLDLLPAQTENWSAPTAGDATAAYSSRESIERRRQEGGCRNLRDDVHYWQTATASTINDSETPESFRLRGLELASRLPVSPPTPPLNVECKGLDCSPPTRTTPHGARSSNETSHWRLLCLVFLALSWKRSRRRWLRLNARFVAWLMGVPLGWTNSRCSATAYARYREQSRSWLCSLSSLIEQDSTSGTLWEIEQ